ncbi:glycoside hydrolase family 37 protein [Moniliophthora roreri MCA 2997]|uniref:alpha,alpha-trehalase n=2 Tax=Moniliophthora roreri TaxID=221103 RepID=V2XJ30_MONRO|nr:glycoside hydrolase family 37 protein [Moniliophthora roreri MCA 2997]
MTSRTNSSVEKGHRERAAVFKEDVIDLWDSEKMRSTIVSSVDHSFTVHPQIAFYGFNVKTNARNNIFSVTAFYPMWSGIFPEDVLQSQETAFKAFLSVNTNRYRYNGTFPSTFVDTGLQWDRPNA